jgi:hypothetical protein
VATIWLTGMPQTAESLGKRTQAFCALPRWDGVIREVHSSHPQIRNAYRCELFPRLIADAHAPDQTTAKPVDDDVPSDVAVAAVGICRAVTIAISVGRTGDGS